MKVVCAWCGKDMGEKEPLDDPSVTHGICQECYHKQRSEPAKEDNGAWWVESGQLHVDIPQLLKNCGLPYTEANKDRAVNMVLLVVAKDLPRTPTVVLSKESEN